MDSQIALLLAQDGIVNGAVYALMALAFEWLIARLPSVMAKPVAVVVGIPLMVMFVASSFALTYTVSVKIFGLPVVKSAASLER